ncbi:conserved hypothetical protein [Haliangium ochraceum DSM 14365]|uniref:Uncharacterized protein n=2 Tax=Haliangium ochraceum TaxID=80816 RepID=D0LH00_HALO1|nr:conserved hypothetical protein [Haliangium ochraceum DSM 14365]
MLLLLACALWELAATWRIGADIPGQAAWREAAAAVRARHAPGDLIAFAPAWNDPVGRLHLGDLIPVDMAARMDDATYGRLWELSIRGASAPEAEGRDEVWRGDFGGVRVRELVREPAEVRTDFAAALAGAKVEGQAVQRPRVRLEEVGFAPHRCVRVEPAPDQSVRIRFPAARLGTRLVGYVGLADVFTRRDVREPGELAVRVDGRELARVRFGVDDGWVRFDGATEPSEAAEVVFEATAVGAGARQRLICFAAEARA